MQGGVLRKYVRCYATLWVCGCCIVLLAPVCRLLHICLHTSR